MVVLALCSPIAALAGTHEQPPSPLARLYDTASPATAPLAPDAFAAKAGWKLVPDDTLKHAFAGHAVAMNDKVAIVLRTGAPSVELHARTPHGFVLRATLRPTGATRILAVKVTDNNTSAVMLQAAFALGNGQTSTLSLRITVGEAIVECRAGAGTSRLFVGSKAAWVVVPDYFAQDMAFAPPPPNTPRIGLPAENMALNLIEGGDAILACVWASAEQNIDLVPLGCHIDCAQGKSISLACIEGKTLWHAANQAKALTDWKPPFPAKWRCDVVRDDGLAVSHDVEDAPVPRRHAGPIVVYPLDRTRATPLTVICPIDVLRNALGVGPCQYVLAMEGMGTDAPATPAAVTQWVERQFKRRRARRKADEIRERLRQMTRHMAATQARIARYTAFAKQARALGAGLGPHAQALGRILDHLDGHMPKPVQASHLNTMAAKIGKLIGQPNAHTAVATLCEQLRAIGTAQDRSLAHCRMAARRLKQLARAADAKPLLALTTNMLRKKGDRP